MRRESRKNDKNCISLSKFSKLYLKTPNGCVIILEQSRRGGKINLFVHTENESVDTRGLFDFHFENQNTRSSFRNIKDDKKMTEKIVVSTDELNPKEVVNATETQLEYVSLIESARLLYRVHFISKNKDVLTRTKVGKLLTVAELSYLKQGKVLFKESISIVGCGTSFTELSEEFFDFNPQLHNELPARYKENDNAKLPDVIKNLLECVYTAFKEYKSPELGVLLDKFKSEISTSNDNGKTYIDKKMAQEKLNDTTFIEKHKENPIIKYILEN